MTGAVAISGPVAGRVEYGEEVWRVLQWALAFLEEGWKVVFLDHLDPRPGLRSSRRVERFVETMRLFGLGSSHSLEIGPDQDPVGLSRSDVVQAVGEADFLLDIAGHVADPEVLGRSSRRALLELAPPGTQPGSRFPQPVPLAEYDALFTLAGTIDEPECGVRPRGSTWIPVRPPVVTRLWPVIDAGQDGPFTFLAGSGVASGPEPRDRCEDRSDVGEVGPFASVPLRTGLLFEMVLDAVPDDGPEVERLKAGGWRLRNTRDVAGGPLHYWRYVRTSRAQFQTTRDPRVGDGNGWISGQTACFMASGRPALVQDTGIPPGLCSGAGLLTFRTPDEAVDRARSIQADWSTHSRAAREIAVEHFDHRVVLESLTNRIAA